MKKLLIRSLLLGVLHASTVQPSMAACLFCDERLVFDRVLLRCLGAEFSALKARLVESGRSYLRINLSKCTEGPKTATRLPQVPSVPDAERPKTAFVADAAGLECLEGLLERGLPKEGNLIEVEISPDCNVVERGER